MNVSPPPSGSLCTARRLRQKTHKLVVALTVILKGVVANVGGELERHDAAASFAEAEDTRHCGSSHVTKTSIKN